MSKEEIADKLDEVLSEHISADSEYNRGIRFGIAYAKSLISEIDGEDNHNG